MACLRRVLCGSTALLIACATAGPPLDGAWRSDRELTLARLDGILDTSPGARWEFLRDAEFFGHTVVLYRGNDVAHVYEGRCSRMPPVKVVASEPSAITYRYFDVLHQRADTSRIEVDGDVLWVDVPLLGEGAREAFRRIPVEEAVADHPCLAEVMSLW